MSLRGRQFSRKIKNLKTNPRREAQGVKNAKRGIYKQRLISIATFFFFHLKHFLVISNLFFNYFNNDSFCFCEYSHLHSSKIYTLFADS